MEFADPDKKPPEDHIYEIVYAGVVPEYFGKRIYLAPFGESGKLEHKVLVAIPDPNIIRNGAIPDDVKRYIMASMCELGIEHLEFMFPEPGDTFLEN